MSLRKFKVLTFDVVGTLIDFEPGMIEYIRGVVPEAARVGDEAILEDILHVAQSQYHDIGVARKLGYTVCWIERRRGLKGFGGTKEAPITKPDYHFATLAELADAVDAEER